MTPESEYAHKLTAAEDAVKIIADGTVLCVGLGVGAPPALARAVADRVRSGSLKNLTLYYQHGLQVMGATLLQPDVLNKVEARTFFVGEADRHMIQRGIAESRNYLSYVPCNFSQIPRALTEAVHVNTFLVTLSPMDKEGYFSLGTNNDYASTVLRNCDRVVAEVNTNMPRVFGDSAVHVSEVHAIVENNADLQEFPTREPDPVSLVLGKMIAEMIPDGATLQLGIGNLSNAVCRYLAERNDLGIHSELFSPAFVPLIRSGVINGRKKSLHRRKHVFTIAMGDREMYEFMDDNPAMESYSSSYVNDIRVIAAHENVVSVNTAIEVDLYGQVNAEFIDGHQYSGSGGQFDFVKGASLSRGGKSFIALKSTARKDEISCIVDNVAMATDTRMDVEHVVTEYGCVNLRGRSTRERAQLLISIAHPAFRDSLTAHARRIDLI
jgi:itaconate CoA-transferase